MVFVRMDSCGIELVVLQVENHSFQNDERRIISSGTHLLSESSKQINYQFFNIQADLVVDKCQILSKSFSLLNSLIFLKQGKYPTLLHRALNLRTHLVDPDEPKSSDLSTLTRELLWHSFAVSWQI